MTMLDVGLQINVVRVEGVAVVMLHGELDAVALPSVLAAFGQLDPDEHVYVDGGGVGFIDAEGLSALADLARRNVIAGCPLHVHASTALRKIVEISEMEHLFAFD